MPISDCEVRDPRVRRTRQLLQQSLRTLMQQKPFDEISVQDLTDQATVNRATFYDHYTDKFALLDAMVGGGFHELLQQRNVSFRDCCPTATQTIVLAACDYLTLAHTSTTICQRQGAFEPLFDAAVANAIRRVIARGMSATSASSAIPPDMIASAASWAIYGAVKEWFYTPDHPPASEVVPVILQLVMPVLQQAAPEPASQSGM